MKSPRVVAWAVALAAFVGLYAGVGAESAITTPVPTNGPLKLDAHRVKDDDGSRVYLLGAIICCGDAQSRGWPLVNDEELDRIHAHGGNYSHVRLGPNSLTSPDATHTGYLRVGNKLDLNQWDASYWSRVRSVVESARVRGVYLEVSIIDGWTFKHQEEVSAWYGPANIQNYNQGNCPVMAAAPGVRHRKWAQKVVDELGAFDNVLWQDGNEVFDCHQDATKWVTGLHDIVRARETERGYRHHLFGTNSQQPALRYLSNTYEIYHSKTAIHSHGRPLLVNEYGTITPAQFKAEALSAVHQEASFMLWKGGMTNTQYAQALDLMQDVRNHVGY